MHRKTRRKRSCSYCAMGRIHNNRVRERISWEKFKDWYNRLDKRRKTPDNSDEPS